MSKVTLYVRDASSVERAKSYAKAHGTSVSELVEGFLSGLDANDATRAPVLAELRRLIGHKTVHASDYAAYLEKKYR